VVLEDAGEFLAPDAKQTSGQALSRLLNICDGALGQATRSLVLATTNEHVRTLHPALARPGRCLANVEYQALNGEEIRQWCALHGLELAERTTATIAELYAQADRRDCPDEERFGFAAAA
jgi:ATP-dependent 26S proteasome regulatory subunit